MKFMEGTRYFSDDRYELVVIGRKEKTASGNYNPRIYATCGFGNPAYYKIRIDRAGGESAVIKGHCFTAE